MLDTTGEVRAQRRKMAEPLISKTSQLNGRVNVSTATDDTKVLIKCCGIPNIAWTHFTVEMPREIRVGAYGRILQAGSLGQHEGKTYAKAHSSERAC